MRVREALESYRNTDELRKLRAHLNEVNAKYRVASHQLAERAKSLQLASQIAETAKGDRLRAETEARNTREELAASVKSARRDQGRPCPGA
jgi:septal ring factor EnvC (AmiA/AmiB activator)